VQAGIVDASLAVELSDEEQRATTTPDDDFGDGSDWGVVPAGLMDLPFEGE